MAVPDEPDGEDPDDTALDDLDTGVDPHDPVAHEACREGPVGLPGSNQCDAF